MFSLIALYLSYRRQVAAETEAVALVPAIVAAEPRIELPLAA
ncbi:hypothetical protein AB2M62_15465 [Sphingomonas sp. MMS12-HWE2-04]